ncbi:hypothetical protein BHE90_015298 [Fusarium euwallaceae]|uniref:Isochorismatase-like domain-containing protein n=1 Tax=Fusarium euwallaceae TaxID=1147111 RepID=A0A430L3T7_9HYPO|nr:hypothetical protein BHE90_015298 [Fusarium euwallaceae]
MTPTLPVRRALVLVDPYNDFLHPDGILTPHLKDLEEKGTVQHMTEALHAARCHNIPVYYGLHQLWNEKTFNGWKHLTPNNIKQDGMKFFQEGTWGAEIYKALEPDSANGDIVVSRHWNSDSFENTDLDFQLRQHEITDLVFAGLTANTCLEATARHAFEL